MDGKETTYGKTPEQIRAEEQTALNMTLQCVKDDTKFMRHEGVDAYKNLPDYLAACKRSDDFLIKLMGEEEGQRILARGAAERAKNIESIKRMSAAEGRVALANSVNEQIKGLVGTAIESDSLSGSADAVEHSCASMEQHDAFQSGLNEVDRIAEESKRQIELGNTDAQTDEEKKAAIEGVNGVTVTTKAGLGAVNNQFSAGLSARHNEQTLGQVGSIRTLNEKIFTLAFKTNLDCGMDRLTAYSKACDATGSAMLEYFGQRIAKGQPKQVIELLDQIESQSDEMFKQSRLVVDADGNPVLDKVTGKQVVGEGQYNPFSMLCCRHSDFDKLRKTAQGVIDDKLRRDKLLTAKKQEDFKLLDAKIRMQADRLSEQPMLDLGKMDKLIKETEDMLADGFVDADKTSAYLSGIIKSAERKYDNAQKDSAKLETAEDFQREYDDYMGFVQKSAPIAFFTKNGVLKSSDGDIDVAKNVDGQNRMILLIRNGQSRGILKGPVWEARLKKLTEDRASEDYDAAMIAISNAGITVDEKASQSLREAFGTRSADIAEELGTSALKSIWGKDENGRLKLVNSKYMMYTWNDPKTGKAVPLSGDEMNQLLKVVSAWQKRHVNPSPNGQPSKDLNDFISGVLKASVRRKTIGHWFKSDEVGVPFAFSDIELAGRRAIQTYFTGDRTKGKEYNMREFYDRDLSLLETATVNGSLPTQSQVIQALCNRLGK